jgi:transposase
MRLYLLLNILGFVATAPWPVSSAPRVRAAAGVSKEFFEALLETFAREAEAGLARIIVLVLDDGGWHGAANLKIPDGIRLIYLPPYSPELQPAETLWALVDEPIVNKHIATIEELDTKIARQCVALAEQREQIRTRTGFHWWPKPINPN